VHWFSARRIGGILPPCPALLEFGRRHIFKCSAPERLIGKAMYHGGGFRRKLDNFVLDLDKKVYDHYWSEFWKRRFGDN